MTDSLKQLLRLIDEARMIDGYSQLNMAEVTRAFCHALLTGCAHERSIDGAQLWVVQTLFAWSHLGLVHGFWILDMDHAHALDFFR